ncbi:MAG TPA: DUF1080 domain-containing protein [Candidatus Sulfotelmatobacter sp.]|nr:DUF1080 domain-containing protein [Candidatus Sulfotelmatobacter sp.]
MKRRSLITGGLLAAGYTLLGRPDAAQAQQKKSMPMMHHAAHAAAGWVTLFDGTSLAGWTPIGDANWRLEDGAAVADKGNGFLMSKDSYGDFELKVEFWVNETANSGVFIRCGDPTSVTGANAYEVNIFDQRPDPTVAIRRGPPCALALTERSLHWSSIGGSVGTAGRDHQRQGTSAALER